VETRVAPPGPYGKEGKVGRGWRLTKVAWTLIRHDRTMLTLALIGIGSVTFCTMLIFALGGYFSQPHHANGGHLGLIALFALYPSILVGVFFNVALACAASAAFDGERMSAGEAIRMAWGKRWRIAAWSLVSAVIGVIVSEIASRLPGGAKLVGWLAGAAWGLATIFVVPILAMEGIGALDAVKRSAGLVKNRWGEGLTGNLAIGAWSVVVAIPAGLILGIGAAVAKTQPGAGLVLFAIGLVALVALSTVVAATRQVFAVALFRYAIDAPIGTFSPADLENPFTGGKDGEKRKSWILRIGVPFLVLFAVLGIVVAIVHPRNEAAEGYYRQADGYYQYSSYIQGALDVGVGASVEYRDRPIGTVVHVEEDGTEIVTTIWVALKYRRFVESHSAYAVGPAGYKNLCIGTPGECHPAAPSY
jgi:hypothetical protein